LPNSGIKDPSGGKALIMGKYTEFFHMVKHEVTHDLLASTI